MDFGFENFDIGNYMNFGFERSDIGIDMDFGFEIVITSKFVLLLFPALRQRDTFFTPKKIYLFADVLTRRP